MNICITLLQRVVVNTLEFFSKTILTLFDSYGLLFLPMENKELDH